jgi:hypothetical protein
MSSGTWTIIIEAPEHNFFAQRQFNLTVGGGGINTVVVTVRVSGLWLSKLTNKIQAD